MFLAGADGQTPELRAPSIKGAMRFWWRAMHGHLALENVLDSKDKTNVNTPGLKKLEAEIFGGGGDNAQRSSFTIQVFPKGNQRQGQYDLVPHRSMRGNALNPGNLFDVKLCLQRGSKVENKGGISLEQLKALFLLTCYLGGLGKRSRRGMGSVEIEAINGDNKILESVDLQKIMQWISTFSPFYQISGDRIIFAYSGASPQYGYIREIQLGRPYTDRESLLMKISETTHKTKSEYGVAQYEPSMGYASSGRYASPVFTSVVLGASRPIITTLNLAPGRNANQASLFVQEDFKKRIL